MIKSPQPPLQNGEIVVGSFFKGGFTSSPFEKGGIRGGFLLPNQ